MGKKRILIVEDEMDFARMVGMRLESIGYETHIAGDAYSGTREILQGEYDLMILDHTYGIGYASSDHLAANDFIRHVKQIKEKHILKKGGHIYATHLSHEGIREYDELQQYALFHGYHIAYDGLTIELR